MGKHTPWRRGHETIRSVELVDVYGRLVATVQGSLAQDAAGTWAKTAGLLLAAPELLEALELALRWFDGDFGYGHEEVAREGAAAAARAAIEKARGGR